MSKLALKKDPHKLSSISFWNNYKPVANPSCKATGAECIQYYPDNEKDMELVKKHAPLNQVWTWITDDDGNEIIVSGYWSSNALVYFITEEPWETMELWLDYWV